MEAYLSHPRREILIGYVILSGVNDSLADAEALVSYLQGLRVKVNCIPYNSQRRDRYAAPSFEDIDRFSAYLKERGFRVLVRHPRGRQIMAACGQLGKSSRAIVKK